ncbi:MAG: sugar-binding transcriptional regulator [Acidimicrobiia bacterium]
MARADRLALMARVAGMYHEEGKTQPQIATRLYLSQAKVSRLLKEAREVGIVKISVSVPMGLHTELEAGLRSSYGLKDAVVVDDVEGDGDLILRNLGSAAAYYLSTTLGKDEVIGISSWSATLLAMVDALHPISGPQALRVVQMLGGLGKPAAQKNATLLTERLAALTGATAQLLPAPGVVGSAAVREALMADPYVQQTFEAMQSITLGLVGIGALEPSTLLAASGNFFADDALRELRDLGAVGDVCLTFIDGAGDLVRAPLDDCVIAVNLEQLRTAPRVVGVAGGAGKLPAIRGAILGGWINVLITDRTTAERLLALASVTA